MHSNFITKEALLDKIDNSQLSLFQNISVDFTRLDFDRDNEFFIPITWGINGILYDSSKIKSAPQTFRELLENKSYSKKISLMPSSIEFLATMKRNGQLSEDWIRTEDSKRLSTAVKQFSDSLSVRKDDPEAPAIMTPQ